MSPWGCVPDACGPLYTREAFAEQLDTLRIPQLKVIEEKLAALGEVSVEQEEAAAAALRDWLEANFGRLQCSVTDARGKPPAPYSTGPVTVLIGVQVYRAWRQFSWSPKRRTSAEAMLGPGDSAHGGDPL